MIIKMKLLIVESAAKAHIIERYLNDIYPDESYRVMASLGHIRDLPVSQLGIEVEDNFRPIYELSAKKASLIAKLRQASREASHVYLASDEDREGEAIAYHLCAALRLPIETTPRIVFHEITKPALRHAIEHSRTVDLHMVMAQQCRRIIDRLVGYELSPIVTRAIGQGSLSAGRVQSVAVRLLVDREQEIRDFTPQMEWICNGIFSPSFNTRLNRSFEQKDQAFTFLRHCRRTTFHLTSKEDSIQKESPPAPFTTSTLQQVMTKQLRMNAKMVMSIAQKLYESGKITYHRTDSTLLSEQVRGQMRDYVVRTFGDNYHKGRIHKTRQQNAQEAHEAIRPTNINLSELDSGSGPERSLYRAIWRRTVATQMSDAEYDVTKWNISIQGREELFIGTKRHLTFDGWKRLYLDHPDPDEDPDQQQQQQPNDWIIGQELEFEEIRVLQNYSRPESRYQEATLVKQLEKLGIGRPSTYATILSTIQDRGYVELRRIPKEMRQMERLILSAEDREIQSLTEEVVYMDEKERLCCTELGQQVVLFLTEHFSEIMSYTFTRDIEQEMDNVAHGNKRWVEVVQSVYDNYHPTVSNLMAHRLVGSNPPSIVGAAAAAAATDQPVQGDGSIGQCSVTGRPIYVGVSKKTGPFIRIGTDDNKTFFSLPKGFRVHPGLRIEDIQPYINYPTHLGELDGHPILIKKGPYGHYLDWNGQRKRCTEHTTREQAIQLIQQPTNITPTPRPEAGTRAAGAAAGAGAGAGDGAAASGTDDVVVGAASSNGWYKVRNGRSEISMKQGQYGPFAIYNKKLYPLPRTWTDLSTITYQQVKAEIDKK